MCVCVSFFNRGIICALLLPMFLLLQILLCLPCFPTNTYFFHASNKSLLDLLFRG